MSGRPPAAADPPVDVAVLGGGPAAAAAATLLAAWGRRVVVLARPAPRRAHAESIPPSAVRLLERTGLRDAIDAAGFVRAGGNTVRWAGEARVESFGAVPGYQVPRAALDRALLRRAAEAGAAVHARAAALDATLPPPPPDGAPRGPARVRWHDGAAHALDARWVLDCTGRAGLLARGRRRAEPGTRTLALVGLWERADRWDLPDATHTVVESLADGWVWSIPAAAGPAARRHVGVMVDPDAAALAGGAALGGAYRAALARTVAARALLRGATLAGAPWARDASGYAAARAAEDGLLLVGDAASFVDPLSSYGIKKALASAWLAAVVAHTALAHPGRLADALAFYERRERQIYGALLRRLGALAAEAHAAHGSPFWAARAALGADAAPLDDGAEPDVAALRRSPGVRRALEGLRARETVRLHAAPTLRRVSRPVVRGNEIAPAEHLAAPAFPEGIRYLCGVDLVALVALAPAQAQVPDLYAAYIRAAGPAALPDFLTALSVLVATGMLVSSDGAGG